MRAADALDAAVGLVDHLGQDKRGEVGQLHGLQARPQALHRVQVGRVGGQPLDHQPVALGVQPGAHGRAAVGGQPVPQQRRLLPAKEASQLPKDFDQAVGVVLARADMEGQLAPPPRTP